MATTVAAAPSKTPPNQTLYITNLTDKIPKDDLRRALYTLFSTYGPCLDVVALRTLKMRGQAHIVYRDVQTSTQAMRALQGFEFFGKEMKISYGKGKSNIVSRLDGTAKMPDKAEGGVSTELQKSIFAAPPSSKPALPPGILKPNGTPAVAQDAGTPQGVKRRREDESDEEGGDAPMEEDDEGGAMEMEESDED